MEAHREGLPMAARPGRRSTGGGGANIGVACMAESGSGDRRRVERVWR
jgi:hypothetical protein